MQINPASITGPATPRALLAPPATEPVQRRSAATPPGAAAVPPPASDPPGGTTPRTLSLDGFSKVWDTSDARYDLNRDGTVDTADLLAFLASMQTPDGQPGSPDVVPARPQAPGLATDAPPTDRTTGPVLTLDGFREAWGTDDPDYDLNRDGTVDTADLLAFLNRPASPPQPPVEPGPDPDQAMTLKGLLEAWGRSDATYDLNGDGTVNTPDLLAFLARQTGPDQPDQPDKAQIIRDMFAKAWGTSNPRLDVNGDGTVNTADLLQFLQGQAAPAPSSADRLADDLIRQFERAGHVDHPPTNLREILDRFDLDTVSRKHVMGRVAAHYPGGLGINMLG